MVRFALYVTLYTIHFVTCSQQSQGADPTETSAQYLLAGEEETERAPHGEGNVYAPEVHRVEQGWWMWYGGQGRDGHDRIHLAESADGQQWMRQGVVIDCGSANHVNDPSVVRALGRWWMFYTIAQQNEYDEIAAATSDDGRHWKTHGVVLSRGRRANWDSLKVGRPSVVFSDGRFRLWYDGQPNDEAVAQDEIAKSVRRVGRAIGYAESVDGLNWNRHDRPVWTSGAGAIHVSRAGATWIMTYEGHAGTSWASSGDGVNWTDRGLLLTKQGEREAFGHVTPCLVISAHSAKGWNGSLYYGAASQPTWNFNQIARQEVTLPISSEEGTE